MASDAYAIAASGMAAQQTQMDLIAANLANVSTIRTAGGGPYHPRTAVLQTSGAFADELQAAQGSGGDDFLITAGLTLDAEDWQQPQGVEVAAIVEDAASSPNATRNETGVDPIEQMVALVAAGRSYDANVAVLQAAKQMDMEASDISRLA